MTLSPPHSCPQPPFISPPPPSHSCPGSPSYHPCNPFTILSLSPPFISPPTTPLHSCPPPLLYCQPPPSASCPRPPPPYITPGFLSILHSSVIALSPVLPYTGLSVTDTAGLELTSGGRTVLKGAPELHNYSCYSAGDWLLGPPSNQSPAA